MNKSELVSQVAELAGLSKADSEKATDALFAAITSALKDNEDVRLVGFGTFSVTSRPAREGRNPQTGKSIQIPASRQPKFSVGKVLKEAINA
jgi:DNA-binding protein HU-beta